MAAATRAKPLGSDASDASEEAFEATSRDAPLKQQKSDIMRQKDLLIAHCQAKWPGSPTFPSDLKQWLLKHKHHDELDRFQALERAYIQLANQVLACVKKVPTRKG